MAIIKSTVIGRAYGSVGDVTLRLSGGDTIASQKVWHPKNPKSRSQMVRRVQLCNLLNMWSAFKGKLHPSFEDKAPRVTDFNKFVGENLGVVPVYLTKTEANASGVVAAGYKITDGSLPSISHSTGVGDVPVTDIALGGLIISASTTLGQFSQAVIQNNSQYANHDQISCFHLTQVANAATGVPYINVITEEVTLDVDDSDTLLHDVCSALCFSSVGGVLGAQSPVPGAIAWVHSRLEEGIVKVSTQYLQATNPILPRYQSVAKIEDAVLSYDGKLTADFLRPNIDPTPVAPVS